MESLRNLKNYLKNKVDGNEVPVIAVSIATISGIFILGKYIKKKSFQQKLRKFEQESIQNNKVILHAMPRWDFSTPHASPYVTKMMAFLEHTKIPYTIDTTMGMHFYTQKMPWITYKNHHQPDSNLIIEWFTKQKDFNNINIDSHLNKKQLAICKAFKSMIEDGLATVIGYRRWYIAENRAKYGEMIFRPVMSPLMAKIMMSMLTGKIEKQLWMQGIARFTRKEVFKKGNELIESVVVTMGDNKFFFGGKLSTLDISIYGHIGGMYQLYSVMTWGDNNTLPAKLPYMKVINEYMKRIEMECFGELKYWKDVA